MASNDRSARLPVDNPNPAEQDISSVPLPLVTEEEGEKGSIKGGSTESSGSPPTTPNVIPFPLENYGIRPRAPFIAPTSRSSSNSQLKGTGSRGGSMLLYRLASENDLASRRASGNTELDSDSVFFKEKVDDKYPTFSPVTPSRPGSGYATPYYNLSRTPTPTSVTLPVFHGGGPRGFVPYEYDPLPDIECPDDDEDILHDPKASREADRKARKRYGAFGFTCGRGLLNLGGLGILVCALLTLFLMYPIYMEHRTAEKNRLIAENPQINATGQAPLFSNIRGLVDSDTPDNVKHRTGFDGQRYELVFSDEFNEPGRTFYPGDDPYFEAMDIWYGVTQDMEWYSPSQVTTRDGALVITMDSVNTLLPNVTPNSTAPFTVPENFNLSYRSGMLQSWNKFCFTSGYIEVGVILPGSSGFDGYWPGAWTMGNLGRPGYRATTDGMWPYSYDDCDVGTFVNQTERGDTGPPAALHSDKSWPQYDQRLSVLTGQRLSACTCPESDHPGPYGKLDSGSNAMRWRGRGAPEIDIIEVQKDDRTPGTVASQSAQFAPFTHDYEFDEAGYTMYDPTKTHLNSYQGSPLQQAISGLTVVPVDGFQTYPSRRFVPYGFEYWANSNNRDEGEITWHVDGVPSVQLRPPAVGPDKGVGGSGVSQRIIPEEPMSIIFNLGMSTNWATPKLDTLVFPAEMLFDYVRVYQREGHTNIGCSPPDYPTKDYINLHMDQYTNINKTLWEYEKPKNRLYDGGC
ncbi:hypothetical protein AAF712_013521 [Marasmius tenuissimus]|uniref:GH16 domain-containing protein n=1 Tax=Marasmius tenuissimus TaxID=585030 RepID=A0ABR2ZEF8_9AGAR